jgi:hypothetical protein
MHEVRLPDREQVRRDPSRMSPKSMSEHRIHFRKAWTAKPRNSLATIRVDLPTTWDGSTAWPARLERSFQAPRIDPSRESVRLVCSEIPGVRQITLNGVTLEHAGRIPMDSWDSWAIDSLLRARNLLVLELEDNPPDLEIGSAWGQVAIEIRARQGAG